jgi:hypothetical protein
MVHRAALALGQLAADHHQIGAAGADRQRPVRVGEDEVDAGGHCRRRLLRCLNNDHEVPGEALESDKCLCGWDSDAHDSSQVEGGQQEEPVRL